MSLTLDQVLLKSKTRLVGLHPAVLAAATTLVKRCYVRGVYIVITQGLRTIEEQNALYAQGRTKPGNIVTNAKGGTSYHNYGLAVDFALLLPNGTTVSWDTKRDGDGDKVADWSEVVQEAKLLGFEWGGDFKSFKDYSHFQMSFGLSITQLQKGMRPQEKPIKEEVVPVNNEIKVDVFVNGKKVGVGILDNGTTFTPARIVAEALGATVEWDKKNLRVDISSKK